MTKPMQPRSRQSFRSSPCRSARGLSVCGLLCVLSFACSRSAAPGDAALAPPPPAQTAAPPAAIAPAAAHAPAAAAAAPKAKLNAPADVHITVSGTRGEVQATLSMRATADIPRCVGRFVVPPGVTVTSGDREKDWGAVANGEQKQLQLTLLVPAQGTFVLAGGMDLYLSSGIRLHQGDAVQLGQ